MSPVPASRLSVVHAKPTVQLGLPAPAGFRILSAIDQATVLCGVDLVLSCGREGHGPADPHTLGEAYDVSVKDLTADQILRVHATLQRLLGPLFTVLYETPRPPTDARLTGIATINAQATAPHVHVQRKTGTIFPPPPTAAARPPL